MSEEKFKASGAPTKQFFVDMLTRDIDLKDAILDLLDNCLDGVVRQKGKADPTETDYYRNFNAKIEITENSFLIEDNCGGIPLDVAQKYAFRMGRPMDEEQENDKLPTVGVYGIGMKRAVFKIGEGAIIQTRFNNEAYTVVIEEDWDKEESWDFPIEILENPQKIPIGTKISINKLNKNIQDSWGSTQNIEKFLAELERTIRESYSFIIQKGFEIRLNNKVIKPSPIQLLVSESPEKDGIKPYVYTKKYPFGEETVDVKLVMGFYKSLQTEEEDEEIAESKRTTSQAGWTITCNDRVILYNDKTHLTGWGEAGIPSYHTQFIGICGVVMFESNNPQLLPMTTTKRGIDLSSPMYSDVKNYMREALKLFTGYTNKWKGRIKEERRLSSQAKRVSIEKFFEESNDLGMKTTTRNNGQIFKPQLPKPKKDTQIKFIRYSKPDDQIQKMREYLFDETNDSEISSSMVGEEAFDRIFSQLIEGEK